MRKFKIQISTRLVFDEGDAKKSKEIISKLKKLDAEHPRLLEKAEEAKEAVWLASEALRKANVLGYGGDQLKKIQAEFYKSQAAVMLPLKEFSDSRNELLEKIRNLSHELRKEVCDYLQNYILEVEKIKTSEEISREPNFETVVSVRQDNYGACQRVIHCLVAFKTRINGMTRESMEEILEAVRIFETEANAINVFSFEKEEIITPLKSSRQ